MISAGRFVGTHAAPVTIVELSDLQCPYCRRFNDAVRTAQAKYPGQVSYEFIHFPLPSHSQALPAARAAECAGKSKRFGEAVDFIFDHQDSLGRKPWRWFAKGSGVTDVAAFESCMKDTSSIPIVQAGLALGKKIDLIGTPTVYLNGWRYGGVPADTELVRAIGDILAGRRPYSGYPARNIATNR
jgi:protein-disulfide isomerase